MKGSKLVLAGSLLMLACIIFLLAPLTVSSHGQVEWIITLILSTEILTPALIFGLALVVYFTSKSHKRRYLQ
jgi:hypothetical protein